MIQVTQRLQTVQISKSLAMWLVIWKYEFCWILNWIVPKPLKESIWSLCTAMATKQGVQGIFSARATGYILVMATGHILSHAYWVYPQSRCKCIFFHHKQEWCSFREITARLILSVCCLYQCHWCSTVDSIVTFQSSMRCIVLCNTFIVVAYYQ